MRGLEEYKKMYKVSVQEELMNIFEYTGKSFDNNREEYKVFKQFFEKTLSTTMKKTSYHFGHSYLNSATIAGVFRMALKEMAQRYKTELIKERE